MADGSDKHISRRAFLAQRMQDAGLLGLAVAAGPVFGRMVSSLYVDDQDRVARAGTQGRDSHDLRGISHDWTTDSDGPGS